MAFRMSAAKVAPIALLWGMFLALTYFNITDLSLKDNIAVLDASVWKGLKEGFKIVVMIFGAFTILNALKATGAIEDVKAAITKFSGEDRRAQLIIIGIFVPIFLEGAAGVFIGSFGSFITGTGLGSNIMFAGMHIEASQLLGINPITVFAGQNAAGSLGNLICPNNVVAACATVNSIGREGDVLRITFRAFFIILIEYMIISMLYTYMIFPGFGL